MNSTSTTLPNNIISTQQHQTCWLPTSATISSQLPTVSPFRTTTYFYNPKTNEVILKQAFDRLTVSATPAPHDRPSTPELGYYSSPATTPTASPKPKSAKMARTVSFGAPEGARDAHPDEKDVMKTFHKHVSHCNTCYSSLTSWRSGSPLCSRGHNYVLDMQPYFFCKAGKPYSMVDRKRKNEQTRIFVPIDYEHVTTLFEALNAGYLTNPSRHQSKSKPVVHQPTFVTAQPEPRRHERPTIIIPTETYHSKRVSPRSGERYHDERRYREPRSRGSLYHEDEQRRSRHGGEIIYESRSPRHHL